MVEKDEHRGLQFRRGMRSLAEMHQVIVEGLLAEKMVPTQASPTLYQIDEFGVPPTPPPADQIKVGSVGNGRMSPDAQKGHQDQRSVVSNPSDKGVNHDKQVT